MEVAAAFSRVLRAWLTPEQMASVIAKNEAGSDRTCASHDYCDANMAMHEAFMSALGREPDPAVSADVSLWNAAWSTAKRARFETEVMKETK